jgi:hypothetical protein
VVGKIPRTGDFALDAQAGKMMLQDMGMWKEVPLTKIMFNHALSFARAASNMHRESIVTRRDVHASTPFSVNSAFAIEVYLKTFLKLHGVELKRIHELDRLYAALPEPARTILEAAALKHGAERPQAEVSDCKSVLDEISSSFVEWRYAYESDGPVHFPMEKVIVITQALHEVCLREGEAQGWKSSP